MTELEKVEKLREKANVTYAEAKAALDASNGDILDAMILLESQGKATTPPGGGFYSNGGSSSSSNEYSQDHARNSKGNNGESFGNMLKRFGRFCLELINKGNNNFLEATKNGRTVLSCPVTVIVILTLFLFWVVIPLFIISLFFGVRYHFRGREMGRDSLNRVMDGAADVVDDVRKSFSGNNNN